MKKTISFILILALALGGAAFAFGDEDIMKFGGDVTELSLNDAIERMTTTGPAFNAVALTKMGNDAAAKGQFEYLDALEEMNEAVRQMQEYGPLMGMTQEQINQATFDVPAMNSLTGLQADLAKDFYTSYSAIAYEAGLNGIKNNTVQMYYGLLLCQESYNVAKTTTGIKETLVENTKKKYNLGVASKMDVLLAENDLMNAKQSEAEALTSLNEMKMQVNMAFNYDVMQELTFTDSLVLTSVPVSDLAGAIESAFANRHEVVKAKFEMDNALLEFNSVKAYPKTSATYMGKETAYKAKQLAYDSTLTNIEIELRSAFMEVKDLKNAVAVAESTYENAKEAARLCQLQYDAGICTLTDLQTAQNNQQAAQLGIYNAIMQYDIAVYSYTYAAKAGVM